MAFYAVNRSNVALNVTDDTITFTAASARKFKLVEISIGGMGTASAANELAVATSSGGTGGGGALTIEPLDSDSAAGATTVQTTWGTQPTLGDEILRLPVNANGGIYRWVARPGSELVTRDGGLISLRSAVGTSNVSIHVVFEEF